MPTRVPYALFASLGLALLSPHAPCMGGELQKPSIRVENVALGDYKGNAFWEEIATTIGQKVLFDLENLRCKEKVDCIKKSDRLHLAARLSRAGHSAEQVEIDSVSSSSTSGANVSTLPATVRIEKAVTEIRAGAPPQATLAFTLKVTYMLSSGAAASTQFTSTASFAVRDLADKEASNREIARLANELFQKEEAVVRQIAEWLSRQ